LVRITVSAASSSLVFEECCAGLIIGCIHTV
jgi:hypothetical protein